MKLNLKLFSLLLILLISAGSLFAKTTQKVLLKNGTVLKGQIIEKKDDGSIIITTNDGFTVTVDAGDIYKIEEMKYASTGSAGVGIGVPYGVIGMGADYHLLNGVHLSVGFGTTVFAGSAFEIGGKYFFREAGHTWRPRVMAFYGVNSMILIEDSWSGDTEGEKYSGLTLGVGQQWTFGDDKRHALDLDLMYLLTRGDFDDDMEAWEDAGYDITGGEARIKLSFGYRYCF